VLDGVQIFQGEWAIFGVALSIEKYYESLWRCTLQKINNGVTAPLPQ